MHRGNYVLYTIVRNFLLYSFGEERREEGEEEGRDGFAYVEN